MSDRAEPLRILLVEDDEDDYLITRDLLAAQDRARFAVEWCPTYAEGLEAIRSGRHELYLVDYRLGARTGLELVRDAFGGPPRRPVILLTGQGDYEVDLEATRLGVTNFLVKRNLDPLSLERSIRYAVRHHRILGDLRRSEERYALAVRAANDGIWDWDVAADDVYFSPRWQAILGRGEDALVAGPDAWFSLVHPDDVGTLQAAVEAHLAGETTHLEGEYRIRHADGDWRWVRSRGLAIRDADGRATRLAGSLSDITDRRNAEQRLVYGALHDSLTGLPNRALFLDRLGQVLRRATRDDGLRCAVLFLDIDRFKLVNDSLSHAVGDRLLVALAARIDSVVRPGDTVARLGGDEFTILLDDCGDEAAARAAAQRVIDVLRGTFVIDGHALVVTASVGIALNGPGADPSELLRNADIAMYHAKRGGGGRCAVFDVGMHRRVADRLSRENELRRAIDDRRIRTVFQPIVDLASGRVTAFEALARWPDDGGSVAPSEFIPIAEDLGLIGQLGRLVLRDATRALSGWRREGTVGSDVSVSVNVSARQLGDPTLFEDVRRALADHRLQGDALRLEITESTLMDDPERTDRALAQLRSLGVTAHLDDFGTGFSSLTLLDRFPGEALKVSGGFVATMTRRRESWLIVSSIIELAHSLGLWVIAEGIEEPEQREQLLRLGCECGQGYLFAKPLAETEVPLRLAELAAGAVPGRPLLTSSG